MKNVSSAREETDDQGRRKGICIVSVQISDIHTLITIP